MSTRIRTNLSGIVSATNKRISTPSFKPTIGKVFGVVTTENTPTKKQFERAGGFSGIGTVFYLDYEQSKNTEGSNSDTFFDRCKIAKPLYPNTQNYPLTGEVILIHPGPSAANQISKTSSQKYYIGTINIWNNPQQNSPSVGSLGQTFIEAADIRKLVSFEGDIIYQGRKGNGIRFGSTVKRFSNINEWSNVGTDGDPITILVNGYKTTPPNVSNPSNVISQIALTPNIEEVNKEMSSIYMTSTQLIPLLPNRQDNINPITLPTLPAKYINGSQIILNSDRITLNSKKDEVMIFANTNVEISTNNVINLNSNLRTHINSPTIFLGTKNDNLPDEPVLLGRSTIYFLNKLIDDLARLGNDLTSVLVPAEGSPLAQVNAAGASFATKINKTRKNLEKLLSQTTFTS